ncbi:HlyC/CorC family transporter [Candidatus Endowatersipora endosymbiont of Watersipora subatra]|uniref:HlyC/CorC family transporter n=1 Tax=Candidatus Endowatersipora endosymbiont of Watersipora subatra TaxID=3077946 RepID=UPI00312C988B
MILTLLAILFLIGLSAFFSGSETALTAVSKARIHALQKNGDRRAGLVSYLIGIQEHLIGALLVSNNLVNILASALATSLFINLFGEFGVFLATVAMTIIVVIFAEILPKSLAISNPDRFALSVVPIVHLIVRFFGPITQIASFIVRRILSLFGIDIDQLVSPLSGNEELRGTVDVLNRDGAVAKDDRDRVGGVLDLNDLEISDIMVHRTTMVSLNIDDSSEDLVNRILDSPHTRLPVWQEENENIIGIIHAKDMLRALAASQYNVKKFDIRNIMAKPWFVPETTSLKKQLNAFLRRKAHIALVVDEYGEVEGLITLEDILEEIVGDISDEHDEDIAGLQVQMDGSVIVDGSLPIRDLNRALDWKLPDEEATTIAGLVIHESQIIPAEKQTFTFYGKRFVVMEREKNRIVQLRIRNLSGSYPVMTEGAD